MAPRGKTRGMQGSKSSERAALQAYLTEDGVCCDRAMAEEKQEARGPPSHMIEGTSSIACNEDAAFECCDSTGGTSHSWRFDEYIGSGAFATVYRACPVVPCTDKSLAPRAAKVLMLVNLSSTARERAADEVRLWSGLGPHPHIITMHASVTTPDHMIILLELATGGELFSRISRGVEVLERDAARWISELLLAVDFLHSAHGIIHRDLKPENMLLATPARDAPLKLTDFGTAKKLVDPSDGTRTPCGSLGYAAPEQMLYLRGQMAVSYGRACDIWSVGITAYTVLSGTLPFNPRSVGWVRTVPARIESGEGMAPYELTFPSSTFGQTSELARDFVSQLLQLDPARRPSAAQAHRHRWLAQWLGSPVSSNGDSTDDEAGRAEAAAAAAVSSVAISDMDAANNAVTHFGADTTVAASSAAAACDFGISGSAIPFARLGAPSTRPPSRRSLLGEPPTAQALATAEQLRGVSPQQFASEWEAAAKVSASWLQRKQSPQLYSRSARASSAGDSRPGSGLSCDSGLQSDDVARGSPSRPQQLAPPVEWSCSERLVEGDGDSSSSVGEELMSGGMHDGVAPTSDVPMVQAARALADVPSASFLLAAFRENSSGGSSSSAGSVASPTGRSGGPVHGPSHFRRRPSPLAQAWRPKAASPVSSPLAMAPHAPSMLFRRKPSPLARWGRGAPSQPKDHSTCETAEMPNLE